MKRTNKLYKEIISIENLTKAAKIASLGKSRQPGVIHHYNNPQFNIEHLHQMLLKKTYKTSDYDIFKIFEPKERTVYRLPFFPDRICHHAIMNILEPIFVRSFTKDTYSCIKRRGIHLASKNVRKSLKNKPATTYCLKIDIRKFYPTVDHDILKALLRKKIKDDELLWLLDEIIDSADGLPIGNYLSQYFANFYLTYFDHWVKEEKKMKHYFRYADDIVVLSASKPILHSLLYDMRLYLQDNLKLEIKSNYQVFPVEARSIDFVGYRFYHTHTLLRKSIKQAFARMLKTRRNKKSIASYNGWAVHADTKHLLKKLLND